MTVANMDWMPVFLGCSEIYEEQYRTQSLIHPLSLSDSRSACNAHVCVFARFTLAPCRACENDWSMGQVWPRRATAHGVRLASIRLVWGWLLRPTAHCVSLASTSLDQVCIWLREAELDPWANIKFYSTATIYAWWIWKLIFSSI